MIDDFADFIFELNEKARDLLESATTLDAELDDKLGKPDEGRVARIQELMNKLCSAMTRVVKILEAPASPLDRFFNRTRGVRMIPDVTDALGEFLKSHEEQLRGMGVTGGAIDKLKGLLEEQVSGTMDEPVKVDQDTKDKKGKDIGILADIRKLQTLVCRSAGAVDQLAKLWTPNLLRACVKGVIGAATVVVDITGVFTIPDVTGWVLFKAAKSTWAGGKMIKNAISAIDEALNVLSANGTRGRLRKVNVGSKGKFKI